MSSRRGDNEDDDNDDYGDEREGEHEDEDEDEPSDSEHASQDPEAQAEDDDDDDEQDDEELETVPADNSATAGQVRVELLSAPLMGLTGRIAGPAADYAYDDGYSPEESVAAQDAELRMRGASEVADLAQLSSGNIATLNVDLRGEYKPPLKEVAEEYRDRHHPRALDGSRLSVWGTDFGTFGVCTCCARPNLGLIRYGVAVSSYFKVLKLLGWMWLVLLLLQLPVLLTNTRAGTYLSGSNTPAVTSMGNLFRAPPPNVSLADVEELYELEIQPFCGAGECVLDRNMLALVYGGLDALTTAVFLMFICCAGRHVRKESRRFRQRTLKLEHYSIMVQVPADCTTQELRDHFEQLVRGNVHDVQLVHATGNAVSMCVRRGYLIKTLARADARRKLLEKTAAATPAQDRAERKYQELYDKVRVLDEHASTKVEEGASLFAFITFASQKDRAHCLKLYRAWTCSPFQSRVLRLHGEKPLRVREAPPPSTLLWENNEVTGKSRTVRSGLTTLLMLGLLMCTVGITFVSEPYKLSKTFADAVTGSGTFDSVCGGLFAGAGTFAEAADMAQDPVVISGFALAGRADLTPLDCLCEASLANDLAFPNGTAPSGLFSGSGLCGPFLAGRAEALSVQVAVSFATLLVNTFMFIMLTTSGAFMRYTSIVERETTIMRRLFVVTYVNTGLLVMLVNADLGRLLQVRLAGTEDLLQGNFVDFSNEWFRIVGVEVLLVAALNIVAPHVYPLVLALINALYRRLHSPVSQTEMNEMYLGADFVLSYRYSQVAMMTFLVMTYSTGLPLLYLFGLISVPVTYYVDKWQFCRITRTPAQLSGRMPEWVMSLLQWAAVVHLCVGMWMLSSPFIFPRSAEDFTLGSLAIEAGIGAQDNATNALQDTGDGFFAQVEQRIFVRQCLPNLLLLIIFVAWKVLRNFRIVVRIAEILLRFLGVALTWCFRGNPLAGMMEDGKAEDDRTMTFEQALDTGAISGIRSYFILANERYARAFQFHGDASQASETTLLGVLRQRAVDESGLSSAFTVAGSKAS